MPTNPMFAKTYQATHPDMMYGALNDDLRDRYLVQEMFAPGEVRLHYSHNERFVIRLVDQIRAAIAAGEFDELQEHVLGRYYSTRAQ